MFYKRNIIFNLSLEINDTFVIIKTVSTAGHEC